MVKVKILKEGKFEYVSLQEMVSVYYKELPPGWNEYLEEVENALKIENEEEYKMFIKKHSYLSYFNLHFDPKNLRNSLQLFRESKYNLIFDLDILKYISYIKELGFFKIINYKIDEKDLDIDNWLSSKNPFQIGNEEEEYSILDLINLKHGMNAIRGKLLIAQKKLIQ